MPADSGSQRLVLIVDDDRAMNESLQRKFQARGCLTEAAFDGAQALKRMSEQVFDVILLDLLMPIEDGLAVLAKKRSSFNGLTPAYVLTSLSGEKLALARELGARGTFIKSDVTPAEVVNKIFHELAW
jgi:CheY-like chemotaxis protein